MKTIVKLQQGDYLNLREGVAKGLLSNRTARALLVPGNKKEIVKYDGQELIPVNSLSTEIQNRIKALPEMTEKPEDPTDDHVSEIEFVLAFAYSSDSIWRKNLVRFREAFLKEEQRVKLAKTYAFVHAACGLYDEGYQLTQIFKAYSNLANTLDLSNFSCSSYDYFSSKLKDLRTNGIERGILNAKTSVVRLDKKKTKVHEKYMIKFYSDPARYKYKKIKQLVNHEVMKLGLEPISLSSVKMFLAQPEIQNTFKPFRYGKKWAEDNLYPYLIREKPKKTNYQWQSDCTCLNFYVQGDDEKSPSRRWLCGVLDTKARKIIAHEIGKYETIELIEATYLKAVMNTHVIPFEILHDNSSAFTSKRIQEIESRMVANGSHMRLSEAENAKDHGCIENVWGILQVDYFRNQRGYLGDGVRSFKEEGRVDPSLRLDYFTGKKDGIWKEAEFKEMVDQSILKFNNGEL